MQFISFTRIIKCEISGFRRGLDEVFALLGSYAAYENDPKYQ